VPRVSVLMPVRNGERFVGHAVSSVLAQTFRDFELVVVDDGSTDRTASIVTSSGDARVRLVPCSGHVGLQRALNLGLRECRGELVARLDADDGCHPERLARQVAFLDARPEVAVVGSLARLVDADGRERGTVRRPCSAVAIRWYSLLDNPFIHSAVLFRRSVTMDAGGYDERLTLAEDLDLWGRLLKAHEGANLPERLVDYRQWDQSIMGDVETGGARRAELQAIMQTLVRRHVSEAIGECPEGRADLLSGFAVGVPAARLGDFLAAFDEVRTRFEAAWPVAAADHDYRRTLAWQYDAVAYRVTPPGRWPAARVYLHALRKRPSLATHLSWPRLAASVLLGRAGRDRLRRSVARANAA
jgi:hypothetical protein